MRSPTGGQGVGSPYGNRTRGAPARRAAAKPRLKVRRLERGASRGRSPCVAWLLDEYLVAHTLPTWNQVEDWLKELNGLKNDLEGQGPYVAWGSRSSSSG